MSATDGHVLHLRARPGVNAGALETVRRQLVELLGARLVDGAVVDDDGLRLHVATSSAVTAHAAAWAGVRALGCEKLFVDDSTEKPSRARHQATRR